MNFEAIFSDETEEYRFPVEPAAGDRVTLRVRTAKDDVKQVWLATHTMEKQLNKIKSEGCFDYYETQIEIGEEPLSYWFLISDEGEFCEYNRLGINGDKDEASLFQINPGRRTPVWARGAVIYQIYVDRFCDGDASNNVRTGEYRYLDREAAAVDWDSLPESFDVHRFYGGDLRGIIKKLDYLQDLGVEVLYLNPIFVSPSNHKYDSQDYDAVDPHLAVIARDGDYQTRVTDPVNLMASNAFFASFIEEIHRRGMKVILDGVLNHCGSFHKWLNREGLYRQEDGYEPGAYETEYSPYRDYFYFHSQHWPDNGSYEGWWGHETMPKLNYDNSDRLWQEVLGIGRKWVSPPYCADGWRLDVAADLGHSMETNHRFWQDFRREVREANPEALVLAEHYGDSYAWIRNGEWDTVMNYDAFMEPVSWYLTGMEKHSDEFREDLLANGEAFWASMQRGMTRLDGGVHMAMNQLSNHDHSRFLTRTNRMVGRLGARTSEEASEGIRFGSMYQAIVMQMTWPGAPALYYGDEVGLCGWTDPDNRRTYPWGRENTELLRLYKEAIRIHKSHPSLRVGSFYKLTCDGPVIAYGRSRGRERIVVAVNAAGETRTVGIPVWKTGASPEGCFKNLLRTSPEGFDQEEGNYPVSGGYLVLDMAGESAAILEECTQEEAVC
ncbi:MAG: glycoside hydrolase family 13 protein [Lachnospiraceae bacterium]|nr:glycoside hydrolase family 13 protein [Lachnospiraceae bacterium]